MEDKETEYATQYFDFVPESIVDELNEEFNELISGALGTIKLVIAEKFKEKVDVPEIEEAISKVEDKYRTEVDNTFEKLSSYLSKAVFRTPRHVLLAEDEVWEDRRSCEVQTKLAKTSSAMETIRSKIKTARYKKKILEESLQDMKVVGQRQEDHIKAYRQLLHTYNISDWKELVELTMDNKKSLYEKMTSLKDLDDFHSKSESLFTSRQRGINSKNCRRILNELQEKTETDAEI